MTLFLSTASSPAEAELAISRGVQVLDVSGIGRREAERIGQAAAARCRICAAFDAPDVTYVKGLDVPGKAVKNVSAVVGEIVPALERWHAGGARAVVLEPPMGARIFEVLDPTSVARFVALCHDTGIEAWISGLIEPPDVPRLLEHRPDVICVNGPGSPGFAALMAAGRKAIAAVDTEVLSGPGDRIIVRDLVLPVLIGAYEFEKERPQRVRFNVEAEVRRLAQTPESIQDVFSYDIILDGIRALVGAGHTILVETLAERTAQMILEHPEVLAVMVRVEKLDLGPAAVGIEIIRRRPPLPGSGAISGGAVS